MSANLSIWDEVECNSGVVLARIPPIVAASQRLALDEQYELTLIAPRGDAWLSNVLIRRVIRAETDFGETFEWRVSEAQDGRANGQPVVEIIAEPISVELRDAGFIKDEVSGGITYMNLGGVNMTTAQYIDTFVLPTLTDAGISWIARGTIDSTERFDMSWDRATPLELIDGLATRLGHEWQLRRNGTTNYLVDIVAQINSSASSVLVAERRNILRIQRERRREGAATVIVPAGVKPDGSQELAGIGQAAWHVTNIATGTPTAGVDTLTLADRGGGDGPIAVDDQFNDNWLLAADGTLHQITDCTATDDTVVISSTATVFATGHDVEIRKDSAGTYLVELPSATGTSAIGRIVGTFEIANQRGERNWARNPWVSSWNSIAGSVAGRVDGAHAPNATAVAVRALPPGLVFASGDFIYWIAEPVGGSDKITAGATVGATGGVSLVLTGNPAIADDDELLLSYHQDREPNEWTDETVTVYLGTASDSRFFGRRKVEITSTQSLIGKAIGNLTSSYILDLDGIAAGEEIQIGDKSTCTLGVGNVITSNWVSTGTGARVSFTVDNKITCSGLSQFTITRPAVMGNRRSNLLSLPRPRKDGQAVVLQTPAITLKKPAEISTVWFSAGITIHGVRAHELRTAPAPGQIGTPCIQLVDVAATTVLASSSVGDLSVASGTSEDVVLRSSYTATGDKELAIRVLGVRNETPAGANDPRPGIDPVNYMRWAQIHIGTDGEVAPIEGSHANKLWQEGNNELLNRHSWLTTYEVGLRELIELWDESPAEPNLTLGGTIRLKVPDMDIDTNVRVVGVNYDLVNPENTRITLDTRRERITRTAARERPKPAFVQVTVEQVQTTSTKLTTSKVSETSTQPQTITGSRRSVSDGNETTGVVPPETVGPNTVAG
jgi:hypothetical protein